MKCYSEAIFLQDNEGSDAVALINAHDLDAVISRAPVLDSQQCDVNSIEEATAADMELVAKYGDYAILANEHLETVSILLVNHGCEHDVLTWGEYLAEQVRKSERSPREFGWDEESFAERHEVAWGESLDADMCEVLGTYDGAADEEVPVARRLGREVADWLGDYYALVAKRTGDPESWSVLLGDSVVIENGYAPLYVRRSAE